MTREYLPGKPGVEHVARSGPKKKPYRRPRITFRETLELMAGTCSSFPAKSSTATCPAGPLVS